MNKLQSIITVIAVLIAGLYMTGYINPYKKQYLADLKAQREVDISALKQNEQSLVETADEAIKNKFTPDTMAGALKEHRGVKIYDDKTGELLDHRDKWDQGNNSLTNALEALKSRVKVLKEPGSAEFQACQENLSRLSNVKDLYTKIMEEAKCQTKPQGPKP